MKLHPRLFIVQQAEAKLGLAVSDIVKEHGLTPTEISMALIDVGRRWLTYALLAERHPKNPGKKADEA